MPRHLTVVFTINDESAFAEEGQRLSDLHKAYDPERPAAWGVSAVSVDDEIRRVELIERAVSEEEPEDAIASLRYF